MIIPDGPQALTTEWLTEALRSGGAIHDARVTGFTASPVGKSGFGRLARLRLTYDLAEPSVPDTLIAKFHSVDPERGAVAERMGFHRREMFFYRQIAPQGDVLAPRCYYGDWAKGRGLVLLLEDMGLDGRGSVDSEQAADLAEVAVRAIAPLHAAWWENPRLDELDWVMMSDNDATRQLWGTWAAQLVPTWDPFWEMAGSGLPPQMGDIGRQALARFGDSLDQFVRPPRTLVHMDYFWSNLCFRETASGTTATILDWQFLSVGRGVFDIAYLLLGLQPEVRRHCELRLLHLYHDLLREGGVNGYTFQQCVEDYRQSLLFELAIWFGTREVVSDAYLAAETHKFQARLTAAILDTNAAELLPT